MKKNILIIAALVGLSACNKIPLIPLPKNVTTMSSSIKAIKVVLKLGDTVRWINVINPHPNNKMIIKALYYNDPAKPLIATVLDGVVFHTDSTSKFIIWK